MVRWSVLLTLGLALILLDGRYHQRWVSPGALTTAHSSIAAESPESCAACHAAAAAPGPHGWLANFASEPGLEDSLRCLDCHFEGQESATVVAAHSVTALPAAESEAAGSPPSLRYALAAVWSGPESTGGGYACAVCHQEHRGRGASLVAMNDVACQSCHVEIIDAFAGNHPSLEAPQKAPSIAFNHPQHEGYWPDDQLVCADCHGVDDGGTTMLTGTFEVSCANCHAQGQEDVHGYRISRNLTTILQPPDMEVGPDVAWPVASGVFISPLMWMLLAGDPQLDEPLEDLYRYDDLGLEAEPYEWYPDDEVLLDDFANGFLRLAEAMASGDEEVLAARLARVSGLAPEDDSVQRLLQQLLAGQFALQAFASRVLGESAGDGPAWEAARAAVGWRVNEEDTAVEYRPVGHADGFARAWIELLVSSRGAGSEGFPGELLTAIRASEFGSGGWLYGTCLECHEQAGAGIAMTWRSRLSRDPASGFAHFTHRSHADIRRGEGQCAECHVLVDPEENERGFASYVKDDCATCHMGDLAPDNCLHCHSYHFERP